MNSEAKIDSFVCIARLFNKKLNSVPILYGSVGLSQALNVEIETDDIDLLIEEQIFDSVRGEIRALMMSLGFVLTDIQENKYLRGSLEVGIASDNDLLAFSGVDPTLLEVIDSQAKYRVLTPNQYLATYKASCLDGYRKHQRKKNDREKIRLIKSVLIP